MSANKAKYLLTLAGKGSENYRVTGFAGEDAIGSPYRFDVEFCVSDAGKALKAVPPDASVLGKDCRLNIECNGETVPYCGIVSEFHALDSGGSEAGHARRDKRSDLRSLRQRVTNTGEQYVT
jgi:uncharacterized protein involved in type VI secretion and phage assembly